MILDIDREGAALAWEGLVPEPNFITINKKNAYAHLAWSLKAGVTTTTAGHIKPLEYLAAIERTYTFLMGADPGYTGLITKNPLHSRWTLWEKHSHAYTLGELAEDLDLKAAKPRSMDEVSGLGRNCLMFDEARQWAYKSVSEYWTRSEADWHQAVLAQCQSINRGFHAPLPTSEVSATARSIAKWVWRHHTPKTRAELIQRTHTPEQQAERGRRASNQSQAGQKSGEVRRELSMSEKARAILLRSDGRTQTEIATELGVSQATVSIWLR